MKKKQISGFLLLEVSISLFILGIISIANISQLRSFKKLYSIQKTQSNFDFIVKSIAAYYLAKGGKVPYPSDSNGIGKEDLKNKFGIVPFKTLGIMEKFAKDGNGKWILYRINPNLGNTKPTLDLKQKNLDLPSFESSFKNDKVALILKSQNHKNKDELILWYSEKIFINNFCNGKTFLPSNHN